jgi:hypothetical protein
MISVRKTLYVLVERLLRLLLDENTKQELAKISAALSKALQSSPPEQWRDAVERAIIRLDEVIERTDDKTP